MNRLAQFWRWPSSLAVEAMIGLIRLYQWTISPIVGRVCRFEPSCSNYAIGSMRKHGLIRGSIKAIQRVARCHPWHPGGYDPP